MAVPRPFDAFELERMTRMGFQSERSWMVAPSGWTTQVERFETDDDSAHGTIYVVKDGFGATRVRIEETRAGTGLTTEFTFPG